MQEFKKKKKINMQEIKKQNPKRQKYTKHTCQFKKIVKNKNNITNRFHLYMQSTDATTSTTTKTQEPVMESFGQSLQTV